VSNAHVHGGSFDDAALDRNWRLACRVATVASALAVALALALQQFAGIGSGMLVALTAIVALALGSRLPAASPRLALQRVRDRLPV